MGPIVLENQFQYEFPNLINIQSLNKDVPNDNLEVIIVDDGSWDQLNTYIDEYG